MTQFTKEKVLEWLESKTPDSYVGHSMNCKQCPLALFLSETYGGRWEVSFVNGEPRSENRDSGGRCALPLWTADFMRRVDGLALARGFHHPDLRLTAGMVLSATRDLLEESVSGEQSSRHKGPCPVVSRETVSGAV